MGVYDTYAGVQLKVSERLMRNYKLGDPVDIPDGVYIAPDGVIIISGGILFERNLPLYTKWGDKLPLDEILKEHNYVKRAVDKAIEDLNEGV